LRVRFDAGRVRISMDSDALADSPPPEPTVAEGEVKLIQ